MVRVVAQSIWDARFRLIQVNASVYILKSKGFDNLHVIYLKTELHNFQTFLAHIDLASYEERLRGRKSTCEADLDSNHFRRHHSQSANTGSEQFKWSAMSCGYCPHPHPARDANITYWAPGGGTPIWNRRGCSSEILNLTPKGNHLGVAQAFFDP